MTLLPPIRYTELASRLSVAMFRCTYFRLANRPGPMVTEGKSVDAQCSEFLSEHDAWPVAQSLTLTPVTASGDGGRVEMEQVLLVTWMDRSDWAGLQARITANAMAIREQERV